MVTSNDIVPEEDLQVKTRDLIPLARAPCWEHRMDNIRREALSMLCRFSQRENAYFTQEPHEHILPVTEAGASVPSVAAEHVSEHSNISAERAMHSMQSIADAQRVASSQVPGQMDLESLD